MTLTLFHMDLAKAVRAIPEELFRHLMEFQFAIKCQAIVTANRTSLAKIVMNVKTVSGTSLAEKVATAASVIQSVHTTLRVTLTPDNVSANRELLDYVATNAKLINTDFRLKVASHAIAMLVDRRVPSAMRMVSAHVMTTLKAAPATVARRTSTIGIKDVSIVQHVTIWFKKQSTSIATSFQRLIMF